MATASATRAVYGGGRNHPSYYNKIDTVEIATTGNATDFGDVTAARSGGQGCGNQTRGLFGPGFNPSGSPTSINTIDFVTIATLGNAQDFGDFTEVIRVGAYLHLLVAYLLEVMALRHLIYSTQYNLLLFQPREMVRILVIFKVLVEEYQTKCQIIMGVCQDNV